MRIFIIIFILSLTLGILFIPYFDDYSLDKFMDKKNNSKQVDDEKKENKEHKENIKRNQEISENCKIMYKQKCCTVGRETTCSKATKADIEKFSQKLANEVCEVKGKNECCKVKVNGKLKITCQKI